jgi:hypothetical protein
MFATHQKNAGDRGWRIRAIIDNLARLAVRRCSALARSGSRTLHPCRRCRGSPTLEAAIYGPSRRPLTAIVVKNVDVAASKRQGVAPSRKAKLLNLQGNLKGVFTGDPLSPRRFPAFTGKSLFSITYVSMRYGLPVEAC